MNGFSDQSEGTAIRSTVFAELRALMDGHGELAASLPKEAFSQRMPGRSNTIGAQFWCVIGARESYADAIRNNGWAGFSCSLPGAATGDQARVVAALQTAAAALGRLLASEATWTDTTDALVVALLAHEAQHQGQLIRYVYALGHGFPQSWMDRWSLGQV